MRLAILAFVAFGCGRASPPQETPEAQAPRPATITDRDWVLIAIGEIPDPRGSGNRPVTLRFDTATSRAMGFAGCNTFSAGYDLSADSLSFQPAISTRMACSEGMELETSFLATLTAITTYQATDSSLTLNGPGGPLARFRMP